MIGGNALGDSSSKNETEKDKKREESFHEKYRRELKKDFDDLIKEDEDEDEEGLDGLNTNDTASDVLGESETDDTPQLNLEDLMNEEEDPEEESAEAKSD